MSKGGGAFKIDHPVDPAHKYLYHSFVESPDMMNVYNGTVTLDSLGRALLHLPDWIGTLNRDFRDQLTPIGAPTVVYISEEVADNTFGIAGGKPVRKCRGRCPASARMPGPKPTASPSKSTNPP